MDTETGIATQSLRKMSEPLLERAEERFWRKVNKNGPISEYAPHLGPCWIWTGAKQPRGYGNVRINNVTRGTHVVSHEFVNGPINPGQEIDHLCRVKSCVNPAHLEAVEPRVNTLRSTSPSAVNALKTHCNRGHVLSGSNVRLRARKGTMRTKRICRACARIYGERQRAAARKFNPLSTMSMVL